MTLPKLPVIDLDGRRGPTEEGKLLKLPDDFELPGDPEDRLRYEERAAQINALLREEEQIARDAGMTVDELRHYKDLLEKKF